MNKTLEQAYQEYYERLFTLALRITGEPDSAQDILQNAFFNALKSWDKFEGRSSYYTWLYTIVLNSAKKYIKEEKRLPVDIYAEENNMTIDGVYSYINSYEEMPESNVIVNQVRETCLQMFLNCLPSKYRITYTLRVILGCSVKECAEILNISENSIKIRQSRAKEMLKEHFNGRCSLINKTGKCNCRTFASHIVASGKEQIMFKKEIINKSEKETLEKFNKALKEVLGIDDLYSTTFKPMPFEQLKERVISLTKEGKNSLLS